MHLLRICLVRLSFHLLCFFTPSGYRKRQDHPQRQQQSLREVHRDRFRQPLPDHWGQHENISVGEIPCRVSGERQLTWKKSFFWFSRQECDAASLCVCFCPLFCSCFLNVRKRPLLRPGMCWLVSTHFLRLPSLCMDYEVEPNLFETLYFRVSLFLCYSVAQIVCILYFVTA